MSRAPWEVEGYSEIARVKRDGGEITVEFENGDVAQLSATSLALPDDAQLRVDLDEPLELEVLVAEEVVRRISWVQIRSATDAAFAQHMRELDADEARRFGRRLKALREDKGMKQAELASFVSMSAPQLSKIEKGAHDIRVSTARSLLRVMDATFADIAGPDVPEVSLKTLARRLASAGVDAASASAFLERLPRQAVHGFIERVFGWGRDAIASGATNVAPLRVAVQFKSPGVVHPEPTPLVHLARAVAEAGRAATGREFERLPTDPTELRAAIEQRFGRVDLRSLLAFVWEHGIPVLPTSGQGEFVASAWDVRGAPVIVLKEPRDVPAFWTFDLAHELGHIACGHLALGAIIDVSEPTSGGSLHSTDRQEREANEFALALLVPGFEELVTEVRRRSNGNYLQFKTAVATTARDYGVNAGVLGVVAAHELVDIGEHKDRWGSSINLSKQDGAAREVAVRAARHYLDLDRLADEDRVLLETVALGERA